MLTIFTTPKPFRGHIHDIQWNALKSWTLLEPRPQILLLGNEFGAEDAARDLGLIHLPEIRRNKHGTPLLSDLLSQAQQHARFPTLMLANADIIFLPGLMQTISSIFTVSSSCLITGRRTNLDVKGRRDFSPGWAKQLEDSVRQNGKVAGPTALDYFIFPKGLLGAVPDFAYGRVYWDNWILFRARSLGADLVDASNGILAVHQNHDYSHVVSDGSSQSVWSGEEAFANRRLVLSGFLMTLDDANFRMDSGMLVPNRKWGHRCWFHQLALAGIRRRAGPDLQNFLNWCARLWWDRNWKTRYAQLLSGPKPYDKPDA
jgi:hypothetical protein